MPTPDVNFYEGHRERLRAKFMAGQLTEAEFVELLLTYAIPRRDVRPISRDLMRRYKGLLNITSAPVDELMKVAGIGPRAAEFFKCIGYSTTLQFQQVLNDKPVFHNYDILLNYCKMLLTNKTREEVHVMYLDANCKLKATELHTIGTLNESSVYPRDIAARAYALNAVFVILVHNHPGGTKTFSNDDKKITMELALTLESMNMRLQDHFLVVNGTIISARDSGLLPKDDATLNPQHHKHSLTEPAE